MSGIVRTAGYGSRDYHLAVSWSVSSQSVTNNSTTLSYRVYTDNNGYSNTWVQYYSANVVINGETVYNTSSSFSGYRGQTLKTGRITIPHNSDGTKSVYISLYADIYSSSGNRKTGGQTINLPRIDRGIYDLRLDSGWSHIDSEKTITYKKYNSSARVEVRWQYWDSVKGEKSGEWILRDTNGNSLASNYPTNRRFRFQDDLIESLHQDKPTNRIATIYLTFRVYVSGRLIQTLTRQTDLNLRADSPNLSVNLKFVGKGQSLLGSSSRGLVLVHDLEISATGTPKNGAFIDKYEVTYDGKTYTSKLGQFKIKSSLVGEKTATVKVVDSRGHHYSVSRSLTVLRYSPPTIKQRAYRSDRGVENPLGITGTITGSIKVDYITNASGRSVNNAWYRIDIEGTTRKSSGIGYNVNLPISTSREYTITYGDEFSEGSITGVIPRGQAPLVLGENAVGVGVTPPINSNGLWVQDGLINGESVITSSHHTFDNVDFEKIADSILRRGKDGINIATLSGSSTSGFGVIYTYWNKKRATGFIKLYSWGQRNLEYRDGRWTVST